MASDPVPMLSAPAILRLAKRTEFVPAKKLVGAKANLREMLTLIDELDEGQ